MGKGHEGNRGSRSEERGGLLQPQHTARIWTVVGLMGNCGSLMHLPSLALVTLQVPVAGEAWQTWLNIDVRSADHHGQAVVLTCRLVCRGAQPAWQCRASCNC